MIVDENLKDCSHDILDNYEKQISKLHVRNNILSVLLIIVSALLILSNILNINYRKANDKLFQQVLKDEQILTLEYSIGYWFINEPEPINDSILYQFLLDNNAWYPDILLKQAKLESGNYTSNIYNQTNNLYGMKKVGRRQTTQLKDTYNGYGCYSNWCESVLDRMLWDVFRFNNIKPTKEEYLKALEQYAEDNNYISKLQ